MYCVDVALGIDHGRLAALLIGDQVGGMGEAAEVELLEDHQSPFGWGTIRMYGRGDSHPSG